MNSSREGLNQKKSVSANILTQLTTAKLIYENPKIDTQQKFAALKTIISAIHDDVNNDYQDLNARLNNKNYAESINNLYKKKIDNAVNAISKINVQAQQASGTKADVAKAFKFITQTAQSIGKPGQHSYFQLSETVRKIIDYTINTEAVEPANNAKTKTSLREAFEKTAQSMNQYVKIGGKSGGANQPGLHGGVYIHPYKITEDGEPKTKLQMILFKQDTKKHFITKKKTIHHDKNIIEFVCGRIMNTLIGDLASSIFFATAPTSANEKLNLPDQGEKKADPDATGENVYIGSVFYDNYKDLFAELKFKKRTPFMEVLNNKKFIDGFCHEKNGKLECNYDHFNETIIASAQINDFDVHSGNIGIVKNDGLRKIDHGGGLAYLEDKIHIHSHSRHSPFSGPINHIREFPRDLTINPHFADEAMRQSKIDLSATIEEAIKKVDEFYGIQPIAAFAKRMGMNVNAILKRYKALDEADASEKNALKQTLVDETKKFLMEKMQKRQQSLAQLSLEIKLSLCITKKKGIFNFSPVEYSDKKDNKSKLSFTIDSLIMENPIYFLKGTFHFRGKDQRLNVTGIDFLDITIKRPIKIRLAEKVNNQLITKLDAIIGNAVKQSDQHVFEALFANKKIMSTLKKNHPKKLSGYKKDYQLLKEKKNAGPNVSSVAVNEPNSPVNQPTAQQTQEKQTPTENVQKQNEALSDNDMVTILEQLLELSRQMLKMLTLIQEFLDIKLEQQPKAHPQNQTADFLNNHEKTLLHPNMEVSPSSQKEASQKPERKEQKPQGRFGG